MEEFNSDECFCLGEVMFDQVLCVDTQPFCVIPFGGGWGLVPVPAAVEVTGVGFWLLLCLLG